MTTPHEKAAKVMRLAEELAALVDTYPQEDEDTPGGYCSVFDEQLDTAASLLREYAALLQAQAKAEPLKVEHDAAMADAARFRWLDEVALSVDMVAYPDNLVRVWHEPMSGYATTGRTLREAVDEAMKRHSSRTATTADNQPETGKE